MTITAFPSSDKGLLSDLEELLENRDLGWLGVAVDEACSLSEASALKYIHRWSKFDLWLKSTFQELLNDLTSNELSFVQMNKEYSIQI